MKEMEAEWLKEEAKLRQEEEKWLQEEKLRKQKAARRSRDVSIRLKKEKEVRCKFNFFSFVSVQNMSNAYYSHSVYSTHNMTFMVCHFTNCSAKTYLPS